VCPARRGYLMTQILGGVWATRFGGKAVLGAGVVGALLLYPATLVKWGCMCMVPCHSTP
jgi:hypothetical protein